MAGRPPDEGGQARARLAVARVLVVALSLAVLLIAARGSLAATWNAWSLLRGGHPTSNSTSEQFESVRRQLAVAVPSGARISVDQTIGTLWIQRITEFAYLQNLTVTHDVRQADFTVTLSQEPGRAPRVVATRIR